MINGLTDLLHPCQGLTDLFTVKEHFGQLDGLKIGYVGDGNNTCHSLINATAKLGLSMVVVTSQKISNRKAMSAIDPALISCSSLRAMDAYSQFLSMALPSTTRMETNANRLRM